ncbi:hypothetical protein BDV18DRAFT_157723 [Aspergillus unguis]
MHSTVLLAFALAAVTSAETFNLYAYGDGIGGLPLHYADGSAVISKNKPANATDTAVVAFTKDRDTDQMVGNPNTTDSNPPFSDQLLYIPGPSSTSKEMGFAAENDSSTDKITDEFVWYGNFMLVKQEDGEYTSLFSVKKTDGDDSEEYNLLWNVTDSTEEVITISMRSVAPSSG